MQKQLLRLPQVREAVGLSRSEIYRLMSLGRFPASIPLGERIVAWDAAEIETFILGRINARARAASDAAQPAV